MRGLRSTLALLVILLGLGAYIYFVTSKQSDDRGSKQEKLFTSVEADKVDELKIKAASGDRTTLKKEGGTWKIVEPVAVAASQPDASAVVNAVADALWREYGVADIDMPATPQAVFRAIRRAEASKRSAP